MKFKLIVGRKMHSFKSCWCSRVKTKPNEDLVDQKFNHLIVVDLSYKYYEGRGIIVCQEWQSFKPFYEWPLKNGYKIGLQIDRINANGNYEPFNCRCVTPQENSQNWSEDELLKSKGYRRKKIFK